LLAKCLAFAEKLEGYEYHWAMAPLVMDSNPEEAAFHLYNSTSNDDYGVMGQALYLAGSLGRQRLEELTDAVLAISGDESRAKGLGALAPYVKGKALRACLDSARNLEGDLKYETLAVLAENLPKGEREATLREVLSWVQKGSDSARYFTLLTVAPLLSSEGRRDALGVANAITDPQWRVRAMAAVLKEMPSERSRSIPVALAAAIQIEERMPRAAALHDLWRAAGEDASVSRQVRRCFVEDVLVFAECATRDELLGFIADHPLAVTPLCSPKLLEGLADAITELTTTWSWPDGTTSLTS